MKQKPQEQVEFARQEALKIAERFKGCCEICDTPEDCRAGKVPCTLSGERLTS